MKFLVGLCLLIACVIIFYFDRLTVNGQDGYSYLELKGVNMRPHLPMLVQ